MTAETTLESQAMIRLGALGLVAVLAISCSSPAAVTPAPTTSPVVTALATPAPTVAATTSPLPSASQQASATAVRFVDATRGWVGTAGGIFATSNGGANWEHQLSAQQITSIRAFDATHAWALAHDGTLYRTVDGARWSAVAPTTPPINEVFFASALTGWAIAAPPRFGGAPGTPPPQVPPVLLRTDDGGVIWRPVGTRSVSSVCFANDRDGYGASGGLVLRTADGGLTWSTAFDIGRADIGPWHPLLVCGDGVRAARVQFTGSSAALGHAPYVTYRTTDTGASWQLEFVEGYTLGSRFPPNTPQLGSYPSLLGSLGSGRTWFVTCSPPVEVQTYVVLDADGATLAKGDVQTRGCASDAQVIDLRHVIAVSLKSVIGTADGGATWRTVYSGPTR